MLAKPREEPVTRRPQSEALIGFFVCTRVRLWASGQMCTCACVPLCASPVCVGPERSGCVCSFSTMKSFLKPVNNVKGKQRGEVEPPSWVPVPLPPLGPQPLAWPSGSQAPIHREVPSLGQGERRRLWARALPACGSLPVCLSSLAAAFLHGAITWMVWI